jgi:hypothetical protein
VDVMILPKLAAETDPAEVRKKVSRMYSCDSQVSVMRWKAYRLLSSLCICAMCVDDAAPAGLRRGGAPAVPADAAHHAGGDAQAVQAGKRCTESAACLQHWWVVVHACLVIY